MIARGWGGMGNRMVVMVKECGVSFWSVENCSEIDCGDGCRTLNILVLKAIELHTING